MKQYYCIRKKLKLNLILLNLSLNHVGNSFSLGKISTILICLFFGSKVVSQIPDLPKSAVSPNAASLGLYGDIPVSLFTGTPSVEIPFDVLRCGNVTIPISLSYHSYGNRPDQHPGWTGIGWTLKAGGMISRVVRGIPDDRKIEITVPEVIQSQLAIINISTNITEFGYYYTCSNGIDYSSIQSLLNANKTNVIDTEPDEFCFNFNDLSGKFYLNNQGEWTVQCDRPVKVEYTGSTVINSFGNTITSRDLKSYVPNFQSGDEIIRTNSSLHFTEFTITDEFGNKYIFGDKNTDFNADYKCIEYSIDFFNQSQIDTRDEYCRGWHATSWMLQKIIAANGEELEFIYERGPFVNQLNFSIQHNSYNLSSQYNNIWEGDGYQANYGGNLISPVYLALIIAPDGKQVVLDKSPSAELRYNIDKYKKFNGLDPEEILSLQTMPFLEYKFPRCEYPLSFESNPVAQLDFLEWQKLDRIKIFYGIDYYNCKTVGFNYSENAEQRLTLNSIEIFEGQSTYKQKYEFDYYHMNLLPEYLTEKIDHWGFANDNNKSFLGSGSTIDEIQYFESREPSSNMIATAGLLKSIIYPTGGKTEFTYEPNDYLKSLGEVKWNANEILHLNNNKITGGARIKSIINIPDPTNEQINSIIKNYFYTNSYHEEFSSGVLGGV